MVGTVWISTAPGHASNQRSLRHSFSETEKQFAIDCRWKNESGESLGPDCFPKQIYGAPNAKEKDYLLPDIFFAGSYWVVSKNAADVLRQFNLGNGALYPVEVLKNDRQTPVGGEWFCINFGNVKQALIPEASPKIKPFPVNRWAPPFVNEDDGITVSQTALSGTDIWVDPLLVQSFFLSDPLAKALKKDKVDKGFFLKKCRVI